MYQHFILIYTGHSKVNRIAFHKSYQDISGIEEFMKFKKKLKSKFSNYTFAFHHLSTQELSFKSVIEYDPFFMGITEYTDLNKFTKLICEDSKTSSLDIAKLLLYKKSYTKVELQKMLYFTFIEHIKKTEEILFEDDFEAWKHGPVIRKIYDLTGEFVGNYSQNKIDKYKDNEETMLQIISKFNDVKLLKKIIKTVDETIEKYDSFDGFDFVRKTHIDDGPWKETYKDGSGQNFVIPIELIKEYALNSY